ncbi:MAG: ATP-binding protein [Natrialbaceae archaeon]|nr:ATP-binding protein [Natrialbaceae archaeon]
MELAEKARAITQLDSLPEGRETEIDVVEHLDDLVTDLELEFPTVDITLEGSDEALVEDVDPYTIDLAFRNVIDNAARHNVNDDPTVTITVEADERAVLVEIRDNGPGLPEIERRTLESGVETSLEHSQGLGLWLTYWCVSLWGGELDLESGSDGTAVTISIPKEPGKTVIETSEPVA